MIAEAEALWKAEQPSAAAHQIPSNWGCVALLCNPDRKVPAWLVEAWAKRVGSETGYGNVRQTHDEGNLVSAEGVLQIAWPRVDGQAVKLDLVIVTANDPTFAEDPPAYPTVEMIASAWNEAGTHVDYFWRNVKNGITTFQDDEIRARVHAREEEGYRMTSNQIVDD